jgi:hypoxanthine phosphoribosyltransferase
MHLSDKPLISELELRAGVQKLAQEINAAYEGKNIQALVVLKGAAFFAADLLKHLKCNVTVDFIRARSYEGTASGGEIAFQYWPECELKNNHVLIIEDILDTGRTCTAILEKVQAQAPASVEICTLLDKPARRTLPVQARFVGFTIEDQFVVGYGMDYNEAYRTLESVHVLEED